MTNIDHTGSLSTDARAVDDHARLVALIGDAIRAGLDSLRLNLGPRVEHLLIDRAVEHIEIASYRLVLDGDNQPTTHQLPADTRRPGPTTTTTRRNHAPVTH